MIFCSMDLTGPATWPAKPRSVAVEPSGSEREINRFQRK